MSDLLITSTVLRLQQEIKLYNPNVSYNVIAPTGQPTFTIRDVFFLQRELGRYSTLPLLNGASRSSQSSNNWQNTSLSETVRRIAGENPRIYNTTNRQKLSLKIERMECKLCIIFQEIILELTTQILIQVEALLA